MGRKTIITPPLIPDVELKLDSGSVTFRSGAWSAPYSDLEIFDATFVEENICSGANVDHSHKKNLYRFIIGKKGVELTNKIAELDDAIREKNAEIDRKGIEIATHIVGGLPLADFVKLKAIENVDQEIAKKESEIAALNKAKDIAQKHALSKIGYFEVPLGEITTLLAKELGEVSKDAVSKTQTHIQRCLDGKGEAWLSYGAGHIKENGCPFCGQDLGGSDLIEAYSAYFSAAYATLKRDIEAMNTHLLSLMGSDKFSVIQTAFETNKGLFEFWKQFIVAELPEADMSAIRAEWSALRGKLLDHVQKKAQTPLEKIEPSAELNAAIDAYKSRKEWLVIYNNAVDALNVLIQKKKEEVQAGNLVDAEKELNKLKNTKIRHEEPVKGLCEEYLLLWDAKKAMTKEKDQAKKELEEYADAFLERYGTAINDYLTKFGVDYQIAKPERSFQGGKASVSYCLKINGVEIQLGDEDTADDEPSFKNTLSGGDKTSLAFAFFLAKLDEENLSTKVIVFDDPICSLDFFRKTCTQQHIIRLAKQAKQVVVLSHDIPFLHLLHENKHELVSCNLQIHKASGVSSILEWDLKTDSLAQIYKDLRKMSFYLKNGALLDEDRRDVARCIRPFVEANIKMRYAEELKKCKQLGDIIGAVRDAETTDEIAALKPFIDEMSDVNGYARRYHHLENINFETEPIPPSELEAFIKRGLKLVGNIFQLV